MKEVETAILAFKLVFVGIPLIGLLVVIVEWVRGAI
tara:strand:- start:198 stop:305 length:108 start_codon:yes stop_codon:yes gene_type:complete